MFQLKKAWTAIAQEKAQTMDSIQQVLETRLAVAAQQTNLAIEDRDAAIPTFIVERDDPVARRARAKREREERERREKEEQEASRQAALEAGVLGGITAGQQQANMMAAMKNAQLQASLQFPDVPEFDSTTAMTLYDPEDWHVAKDSSGRTYYYNLATGQSSWIMPTTAAEPPLGSEAAKAKFAKLKPPKLKAIEKSFGTNKHTFRFLALEDRGRDASKGIRDRDPWDAGSEDSGMRDPRVMSQLRRIADEESGLSEEAIWEEGEDFPDFSRGAPPDDGRPGSGSGGSMQDRLDL